MRIRRLLVSLATLALGCDKLGPAPPPPQVSSLTGGVDPETGVVRYLALGDSVSQGVGAADMATGSFPALLAAKWRKAGLQVELKNPAVVRYTADDVIRTEVPLIAEFKPTIITFQIGANDIANGVPIEKYRQNLQTILDAALKSGARVLVLPQNEWFRSPDGPSYGKDLATKRAAFDTVLIEETKAKGGELVDLRHVYRQQHEKKMWSEDGIHPTGEAYAGWADEIARVVPVPSKRKP